MFQTLENDEEMGTKLIFVGVDGEMTGTELSEKHRLCQIGVAFDMHTTFVSDIGWGPSDYNWVQPALDVNKFTLSRIEKGPIASFVDGMLPAFLEANGGLSDKKILIPVGFNVGSFDMPFIHDALPNSFMYFSRRTVDLNAICFSMDGIIYNGSAVTWKGWKRMAKADAKAKMYAAAIEGEEHDARFDAIIAILAFDFLRKIRSSIG